MKAIFIIIIVMFVIACNEEKVPTVAKVESSSSKVDLPDEIAEEDCDDKLKKEEEEKKKKALEEFSLTDEGDAGCELDAAH